MITEVLISACPTSPGGSFGTPGALLVPEGFEFTFTLLADELSLFG